MQCGKGCLGGAKRGIWTYYLPQEGNRITVLLLKWEMVSGCLGRCENVRPQDTENPSLVLSRFSHCIYHVRLLIIRCHLREEAVSTAKMKPPVAGRSQF